MAVDGAPSKTNIPGTTSGTRENRLVNESWYSLRLCTPPETMPVPTANDLRYGGPSSIFEVGTFGFFSSAYQQVGITLGRWFSKPRSSDTWVDIWV